MMTNSDARKRQAGESQGRREWKPGDVAMTVANRRTAKNRIALRVEDYWGAYWRHDEAIARPLIVIDPEDREQVERLVATFADALNWGPHNIQRDTYVEPMQAALREFANPTPPRPDEPTGLGAVVEDDRGDLWVRDKTTTTRRHWKRARGEDGGRRHLYADITAVRKLSDGVQP